MRAVVLLIVVASAQLAQSAAAPPPPAVATGAAPSFGAGSDAGAPAGASLFAVQVPQPDQAGLAASFVPDARLLVDDALDLRHPGAAPRAVVVRVAAVDAPPGVEATLTFHPQGHAPVLLALQPGAWALVPLDADAPDVRASLSVQSAPGAAPPASIVRALLVLGA